MLGRCKICIYGLLAFEIKPKERLQSIRFTTNAAEKSCKLSYRECVDDINSSQLRNENDSIKLRTLSDQMCNIGKNIQLRKQYLADNILTVCNISDDIIDNTIKNTKNGKENDNPIILLPNLTIVPFNLTNIQNSIEIYNDNKYNECYKINNKKLINRVSIENPQNTVYISIDQIGVPHQKDSRKKDKKERKTVQNTVIHIKIRHIKYLITDLSMFNAFKQLVAFLLYNNFIESPWQLCFLTDGASNIKRYINIFFGLKNVQVILDWYHLDNRLYENFSMIFKSGDYQKETFKKLCSMLWVGNVDAGIEFLRQANKKEIKNQKWFDKTIDYLERKKPYIVCYALRKLLKYPNSSNPAETYNKLLVANRQKHSGMSWSSKGSASLATISASLYNGEFEMWISRQTVSFYRECA